MATDWVLRGLRLTPDDVSEHEFAHGFRGYDVHEVRSFLQIVAGEMARLAESTESGATTHVDPVESLSRDRLTDLVGEQAARVLQAAEDAGAEIRTRAEENVEKMLRDARTEAAQLRATADQSRADTLQSSDAELASARDQASAILAQAETDAQAQRDAAVEQGRTMLDEAIGAREQVLRELATKRKKARRELTQLRAGIEQLHESYDELRSMLDASAMVLGGAVDGARSSAAAAADRFDRGDSDDDLAVVESHVGTVQLPDQFAPEPVRALPSRPVDVAPTMDDTANIRAERHREIRRREPKPAPAVPTPSPVAPVEMVPSADLTETTETIDVTDEAETITISVDVEVSTDIEDTVEAVETVEEDNPPAPEIEIPVEAVADVSDVDVSDADVSAEPMEPLEEFDEPRTAVDQLFARIRTSREAVEAHVNPTSAKAPPKAEPAPERVEHRAPDSVVEASSRAMIKTFNEAVDDLAPQAARSLKRCLADQLNEVLDAHRRAGQVESVDQIMRPEADLQFGQAILAVLELAADRGAGVDSSGVDVSAVMDVVARDVGAALRTKVEGYLSNSEGLDQRIRAIYREWRRERADEIAASAVVEAFNMGVIANLDHEAKVRWVTPVGGCVHIDCADNALAEPLTVGSPFPTGHTTAPLGPGCRCLVVPSGQ